MPYRSTRAGQVESLSPRKPSTAPAAAPPKDPLSQSRLPRMPSATHCGHGRRSKGRRGGEQAGDAAPKLQFQEMSIAMKRIPKRWGSMVGPAVCTTHVYGGICQPHKAQGGAILHHHAPRPCQRGPGLVPQHYRDVAPVGRDGSQQTSRNEPRPQAHGYPGGALLLPLCNHCSQIADQMGSQELCAPGLPLS